MKDEKFAHLKCVSFVDRFELLPQLLDQNEATVRESAEGLNECSKTFEYAGKKL